ncbi:restriction endonuclease subunit S [Rhodovarius crocodyli]|uniref:Restriction endonuclease subunit S n=1 Tax=Rhodovarius crocodyli TaxID=1979269 RepID=A0A437LW46_9PROT|nr:restriction endonuclease subunit S [Rhodovarius crocodyli]RVT89602.1 restriction endonuclease subunit S [Rhodovarius crocodyli]
MSDDGSFKFNINDTGGEIAVSKEYPVFKTVGLDPKFLLEILNESQDFKSFAFSQKAGGTRTRLYFSKLREWRTALPTLLEQQKIADCLNSADELIAAQGRKVDALKAHKKGLMQQLFPQAGETQPRLRFPEFEGTGEWSVKPLGKAAENLDNQRVPITSGDRVAGDVPYYGASGIVDYVEGYIFDEDLLCVSEDGANLLARTYPIAFAISGKTWVNNHAHVLRFKHGFTQKFVEVYLNSIKLDDFITGMAQPKLNKAKLDSIPMPLPKEPEQKRIADCLSSLDNLIAAETRKLDTLKTHKKGLIQQLFPWGGEADT